MLISTKCLCLMLKNVYMSKIIKYNKGHFKKKYIYIYIYINILVFLKKSYLLMNGFWIFWFNMEDMVSSYLVLKQFLVILIATDIWGENCEIWC